MNKTKKIVLTMVATILMTLMMTSCGTEKEPVKENNYPTLWVSFQKPKKWNKYQIKGVEIDEEKDKYCYLVSSEEDDIKKIILENGLMKLFNDKSEAPVIVSSGFYMEIKEE